MKHRLNLLPLLAFILAATFLPAACSEDNTQIGLDLEDPLTLFEGKHDTLYANLAFSFHDDSLLTSNYSLAIIGNYADNTFGSVSSTLYTQIALPTTATSINFATDGTGLVIDSVVLSLYRTRLFPDSTADYRFHFQVRQLAEPLLSDTSYYATDALPVDPSVPAFYDQVHTIHADDSIVRLRLNDNIKNLLATSASADDFLARTKGLRISILDDADLGMLTFNCSAITTALIAYYHYEGIDTTESEYSFDITSSANHFTHFEHDYSATRFSSAAPIVGDVRLYLEPLGGHNVKIVFDEQVKAFSEAHPNAVVHYAEMQLTPAPESSSLLPDRIIAFTHDADGNEVYINDARDSYTYLGYDGNYYSDKNYYRMRVTQHLQGMLRAGGDEGTLLVLNSRRSAAERLVLGGFNAGAIRPRIVFVYSE